MKSKNFNEKLAKLRQEMPHNYRSMIVKNTDGISIHKVNRAFAGELKNVEDLNKIFTAAAKIVRKQRRKQARIDRSISLTLSSTPKP